MEKTEILYNGRCPICSAEIAHYRKQAEAADAPLHFTDLHDADLAGWALTPDQATRRIHARRDGQIISGFPAFLLMWQELPRMRWLARLLGLPVLRHGAEIAYNRLAAPLLYALHKRREARHA
ncbi:MAG: thiol-disulfide oxidoreductase DCC family protein [Roseinatronobacter sp.]